MKRSAKAIFFCAALPLLLLAAFLYEKPEDAPIPTDESGVFYVDGMRVDAQFLQNQMEANEAAARFDQLYDGGENYPDYYGGAYLDKASGHLVFLTCGASEEQLAHCKEVLNNPNVRYEEADYSYNALKALEQYLVDRLPYCESYLGTTVTGIGIDEEANRLVLSVLEPEKCPPLDDQLAPLLDPDMILIRQGSIAQEY